MLKVNLGCGWRNFGKDWIHIDGGDYEHLDYHSITELPFNDGTVDLLYASHVFEYFDRTEIIPLLQEWRRVLKPGGIFRLAVPDYAKLNELYHSGYFELDQLLGSLYGKMPMADQTIYHKTIYDYVSLEKVLLRNRFKDIKNWDWRKTIHSQYDDFSQAYNPHMDKENGILLSLNIECKK